MKTAMIWGANSSIGQDLTAILAAEGWQVAAIVRNGKDVPGAALTIEADVTDAARLSAYAATKSGLEAFADSLRKEQRKRRVLVVRPGAVATPL